MLDFRACAELLRARIDEPAPARIQLLAGPRQVGKTTLLLDLAERLGDRARYLAADGPEGMLPGAWERLWASVEQAAAGDRVVVLLDEAHLLHDWAGRLKGQWDRIRRRKLPVQIVATGSSALHLGAGSRESLAGRFEKLTLAHWSASSLVEVLGAEPREAAHAIVTSGGYPGAWPYRGDPPRWSAYVKDAIVEPVIGRDLLALGSIRKPALLRQLFAVCVASPAQVVAVKKMQGQLQDAGALETIAHYLALLEEAFLVASAPKFSPRVARRRGSPPKLVTLNNALVAAMDPLGAPDRKADPTRFGAWVENACLAHAWNAGQELSYWREEPLEVDGVIEGSWGKWAIEIKTGAFGAHDLRGLAELTRRHPQYRPLVICDPSGCAGAERLGFGAIGWPDFLLGGPPR